MYKTVFAMMGLVVCISGGALGVAPDPQLGTDHPVYRGELSCSTLDRRVDDAYRVFTDRYGHTPATETEKLVALWAWQCEHHMHNGDPYVYGGLEHPEASGAVPGWVETRDDGLGQFSFGFALCYTIHAQFSALVGHALGDLMAVRCPNVPGHTPFEAYVDGKWALADMTTGMMVFDDAGKPMSIEEIMPFVNVPKEQEDKWTSDPRRGGFGKFAMVPFGDNWDVYREVKAQQKLYGYNAYPIVYSLRPGEVFTRYLDPGLEDGKTWCFWGMDYYEHSGKTVHGPFRNVTFLDDPPIGQNRNGRGNAYYANGVFEYTPPLADGRYRDGLWKEGKAPNLVYADSTLRSAEGPAQVVFEHTSPYVIAARAADNGARKWNVRQDKCSDGAVASGKAVGEVPIAVSVDAGATWRTIGTAKGDFKFDFTDVVKGRHTYLIRFDLTASDGLGALTLRTVTQASRAVFPRLKDGGTTVTYQASGQVPVIGGPAMELAERFRHTAMETPGMRVYKIAAPGPIRHVAGVSRSSDTREGNGPFGPWSVEFSIDSGKTWITGMKPTTVSKTDSDWGGARHAYAWAEKDFPEGTSKDVLVRFGTRDILACEVYATYEVANTTPVTVTYGWTEGGKARDASHEIAAGAAKDTWTIKTGKDVVTKWVRMEGK